MSKPEELDITPSPRLLEVIGDLDVPLWQCLAELIDNAFDGYHRMLDSDENIVPTIHITVPDEDTLPENAFVEVRDNATGMELGALRQALRAGYSGNERFGSLGLFGMGFNVATARLGNLTEVRTSTAGEPDWLVARIDLRDLQHREAFRIPLERQPKSSLAESGTTVRVSGLRSEVFESLRRKTQRNQIREVLGDVYSYLLRNRESGGLRDHPVWLLLNQQRIVAQLPCIWGRERSVTRRGVETPAVIDIDEELADALACVACGHWLQSTEASECPECRSTNLAMRSRRVHGWVGIQRYLDKSNYGIDFIRNGRKILRRDKTIFAWVDPDNGREEPEYPIELPNGQGRIVGEIHVDHVPVSYRKHDFQRESRAWRNVVRVLRGDAPLLPNKAKQLGYAENDSPLAKLFNAYRRNDPGLACLIPGDSQGKAAIHEKARQWAKNFERGVPEYQDDSIWYMAAVSSDRARGVELPDSGVPNEQATREAFAEAGLGDFFPPPETEEEGVRAADEEPADGDAGPAKDSPPITDAEWFGRLRSRARRYFDLDGELTLPRLDTFRLSTYGVVGEDLRRDPGVALPAIAWMPSGAELEVFVDEGHEVFVDFGKDPRDYALLAAAQTLHRRNPQEQLLRVLVQVTTQFPDQRLNASSVRERIEDLLHALQTLTAGAIVDNADQFWLMVSHTERQASERLAQSTRPRLDWGEATRSVDFVEFLSLAAIADLVEAAPEVLLDGNVFAVRFSTWTEAQEDSQVASDLATDLRALSRFLADGAHLDRDAVIRATLTERMVRAQVADLR